MTRFPQLIALLVLAAVSASAMSAEFAGTAGPQDLRWRSAVIRIAISSSLTSQNSSVKADSDVLGALSRSIDAWESATGLQFKVETTDRQTVSGAGTAGDGVSLLTIAPTPENLQLFASDPFGESARTRVFYNRKGAITEGDIVLNPLQQFSTDGTYGTFDLETTFSHEIGHLLGLKHSGVSGSIMAERIPRNTDIYPGPRIPTQEDIAAVRDLYGVENDSCCGAVYGKLYLSGRSVKNVTVWAEDGQGRVAAKAEAAVDGTYRLGGLANAKYQVFWQRRDANGTSSGELGSVTIDDGASSTLSKRITGEQSDVLVQYLGLNLQPSDAAVVVKAGRQYDICLAGRGLAGVTSISFSSKLIHVNAPPVALQELVGKVDALTVSVTLDTETPAGVYTLYAERRDGSRAAAVGAIVVAR